MSVMCYNQGASPPVDLNSKDDSRCLKGKLISQLQLGTECAVHKVESAPIITDKNISRVLVPAEQNKLEHNVYMV